MSKFLLACLCATIGLVGLTVAGAFDSVFAQDAAGSAATKSEAVSKADTTKEAKSEGASCAGCAGCADKAKAQESGAVSTDKKAEKSEGSCCGSCAGGCADKAKAQESGAVSTDKKAEKSEGSCCGSCNGGCADKAKAQESGAVSTDKKAETAGESKACEGACGKGCEGSACQNCAACQAAAVTEATIDKAAPAFTLTSVDGKRVSLSQYKGKYVVLEWTNYGCPFVVKHYAEGHMQAVQKKYMDKDVVWLSICSSSAGAQGHKSDDDHKKAMKEWNVSVSAFLTDADGTVGKLYKASRTPEMYIIDKEGVLRYMGAIDSDSKNIKTAENYVTKSLDELLAGKEVSTKTTKAYGCSVKYAKAEAKVEEKKAEAKQVEDKKVEEKKADAPADKPAEKTPQS